MEHSTEHGSVTRRRRINITNYIMDLVQIMDIIKSAVDAGIQEYKRSVEPDVDYVTQSEAQRYIRRMGYRPSIIFKWKSENLLTPVKTGDSKNSSVLYSMAEIKKLVCSIQIKNLLLSATHPKRMSL